MQFIFYKDRKKEWRWKAVAANNRKLACSGEGYKNKRDCMEALGKVVDAQDAYVEAAAEFMGECGP
jgi:uncharacterized protein